MSSPTHRTAPERHQLPAVQKMWIRFAKRGRLRFTSHRDFQRAFERALRRAGVPVAFSHGFTPHPKVSFIGAAPTGTASEAEYLEISLTERCDPEKLRAELDDALSPGLDIVAVTEADGGTGSLADHLQASAWIIEFPEADPGALREALHLFLAAESVEVERLTKKGVRTLDARGAVLDANFADAGAAGANAGAAAGTPADHTGGDAPPAARVVVEHQSPTIRPEEIVAALRVVAGFEAPSAPRVTRLAQGSWNAERAELIAPPL